MNGVPPFATKVEDDTLEGEERFEDGRLIKLAANATIITPGDLVHVEWGMQGATAREFDLATVSNWVRGGLTSVRIGSGDGKMPELGVTPPRMSRVGIWKINLAAGWLMGTLEPVMESATGRSGTHAMALKSTVHRSSITWHWELRTDDIPGWQIFVVGHKCSLHEGRECGGTDRAQRFADAREMKARGMKYAVRTDAGLTSTEDLTGTE